MIDPSYDPKEVEAKWYPIWESKGLFTADAESKKPPFVIVMPPPNITGSLHMGHALTATLEDTLTRWRRMQGYNALWLPGTDHASISTQLVVERELKKEGTSRAALGRSAFLERVWQWKEKYGSRIEEQHRVLGASCDWSRNAFTMSPKLNRAVREVFVRLWDEKLIYRAERLINWCPTCQTALSDLEVEHEEGVKSSLWHLRYPVVGQPGRFVVVATTRPETMLGDTAVAVHSSDTRYKDLHGKQLQLPLTDRTIPLIIDDILVDPEFGSGAVKVTPAHDFNDFAVGKRHALPMPSVLDKDSKISVPGPFFGLDRAKAREAVAAALESAGLLDHIEAHTLSLGRCERSKDVVEPMLSTQWYVKTEPLAKPALDAVKSGEVKILPEHWTKTYEHWMTNIQDWCVSRQLWWGHQIPAWYCVSCDKVEANAQVMPKEAAPIVSREAPSECPRCHGKNLVQDPDVLDTWFSSGLWPFSTLGWPDDTADLRAFYPNTVMETGSDIIFFWVARMMMMGIHFLGKPPFSTIYLHSIVRDEHGQKMSKSKGNGIDPLDLIHGAPKERVPKQLAKAYPDGLPAFGTDAMRFTLAAASAAGRDIKLNLDQMQGYRAFCNKVWNATRFALMNLEDFAPRSGVPSSDFLADRWIRSRFSHAVAAVNAGLEAFNFSEAALALYHFFWNELCDWYVELVKPVLRGEVGEKAATQHNLVWVFDQTLRLLHPFMPFISEELWQSLPISRESEFLIRADYPKVGARDLEAEAQIALLVETITALRNIRGEHQLAPSKKLKATIHADKAACARLAKNETDILRLAMLESVAFSDQPVAPQKETAMSVVGAIQAVVSLEGLIDYAKEAERQRKELGKITAEIERLNGKLGNEAFVSRAPPELIAKERDKVAELQGQVGKLTASLAAIDRKA